MAQTSPLSSESLVVQPARPSRFGHFARKLGGELELSDFRTGRWFSKLVTLYLRHYDAHGMHEHVRARGARAKVTEAIIQRACVEAGLVGTGAASVTTGASLYASDTGGAGLFVAVPVSMLAIGGEAVLRTLVHLRMTCDLASAYGVRLEPDDPADLSRLYALVFGTERRGREDSGRGLLERLVSSEAEDLGGKLGSKLLGESLARNVVPIAGVLTSPVASWRRTRHLGDTLLRYVRFRRALGDAFTAVARRYEEGGELLVESAWFLLNTDGWLDEDKAGLLAHLLRQLPRESRRRIMARLEEDESDWLQRLRRVPAPVRGLFLHALVVISAADTGRPPLRWGALEQAARALGRSVDRAHHDALKRRFREEGVVSAPVPAPEATVHEEPPRKKRARPAARRKQAEATGTPLH